MGSLNPEGSVVLNVIYFWQTRITPILVNRIRTAASNCFSCNFVQSLYYQTANARRAPKTLHLVWGTVLFWQTHLTYSDFKLPPITMAKVQQSHCLQLRWHLSWLNLSRARGIGALVQNLNHLSEYPCLSPVMAPNLKIREMMHVWAQSWIKIIRVSEIELSHARQAIFKSSLWLSNAAKAQTFRQRNRTGQAVSTYYRCFPPCFSIHLLADSCLSHLNTMLSTDAFFESCLPQTSEADASWVQYCNSNGKLQLLIQGFAWKCRATASHGVKRQCNIQYYFNQACYLPPSTWSEVVQ